MAAHLLSKCYSGVRTVFTLRSFSTAFPNRWDFSDSDKCSKIVSDYEDAAIKFEVSVFDLVNKVDPPIPEIDYPSNILQCTTVHGLEYRVGYNKPPIDPEQFLFTADASVAKCRGGYGVSVIDHLGRFVDAEQGGLGIMAKGDVAFGEAVSIRVSQIKGYRMVAQKRCSSFKILNDNVNVVKAIVRKYYPDMYGHVIREIVDDMKRDPDGVCLIGITNRITNFTVDLISKKSTVLNKGEVKQYPTFGSLSEDIQIGLEEDRIKKCRYSLMKKKKQKK